MGTITSLFVRKVVAQAQGMDPQTLLHSIGLPLEEKSEPARMVEDTAYYDLIEQIARALPDASGFPLRVGASMRCDDYGAFGLAWKTAATPRASLARAERYWRLLTSVTEYEVRPNGDDIWYLLHRSGECRLGLRLSNEMSLASTVTILREVATAPFAPAEVHLRHRAPQGHPPHARWFGCPVVFGSDHDALVISDAALSVPNRQADEALARYLALHLDEALAKVEAGLGIGARVRETITASLSSGVPHLCEIARRMGTSERTLQRRLEDEGLTFQTLVDHARRDLAQGLLTDTHYTLAEIAFLVGFSEQSAFTRAFKRWNDRTPAQYRRTHRSG